MAMSKSELKEQAAKAGLALAREKPGSMYPRRMSQKGWPASV